MDTEEIRTLMEDQLRLSRQLKARIRELEDERHAPLAVVGMGMRLPPDLDSPDTYWEYLRGERRSQSPVPDDRPGLRAAYDPVPGRPGRSYVEQAGFLDDIAGFDAGFFGISQREATLLDPQQRMLLETAWEALERAGIAVRRADRLDVGVYLGMMASEYSERLEDRDDMSRIDPYYTTGGGLCFPAGRISYLMGFSGPVVSVDTACSSSLSALHLATRALRGGECRYALVCGSNLLLSASLMVSLCQTRALSPEGRSKSFLADADGYGRGEGVGALALMRLSDAEREGRPVLAVVRGSAVNHDGAASGLTAPNGPAQREVITAALADAHVDPADLGWIEAHGTGTVLGDPVEIGALDGALGDAVRERGIPLAVGSVKSRLGHLEAASGIAAVMKTVLMLQHGEIPAAADDSDGELNPHIPWDRLRFSVPRRNQPWPAELPRRVAGVNSFGMSGTNAHVVLEAYAPPSGGAAGAAPGGPELLVLSARDPEALRALASGVVDRLRKTPPEDLASLCHTLRSGRAFFAHRIAVTGGTPTELADALTAAAESPHHVESATAAPRSVTLAVTADAPRVREGLDALTSAYPALGDASGASAGAGLEGDTASPGERLAALLRPFGVRVESGGAARPGGTDAADTDAAVLTWEADGDTHGRPLVRDAAQDAPRLLLDALADLFTGGADLRLDALGAPGTRLTGDLPTYPFQRRRYWVEEPVPGTARAADGAPGAGGTASGGASGSGVPLPATRDRAAIAAYLEAELKSVLHASDDPHPEQSFLDIGGDSFTSTLFITRIEENFDVGLTPEDLPLDLPMAELIARLTDDIAGRSRGAEENS